MEQEWTKGDFLDQYYVAVRVGGEDLIEMGLGVGEDTHQLLADIRGAVERFRAKRESYQDREGGC